MPQDRPGIGEENSGEKVAKPVSNDDNLDISVAERTHVKELKAWVKRCERQEWPDNKTIAKICEENRTYVEGKQHTDGESGLVRANLIQASIRRTTNRTYARNPEISIVPTEAVNATQYKLFRAFGKTSEIVVNHFLSKAKIKKKAKSNLRAAKTCRVGWLKVGLQKNLRTDAHIKSRIQDLQDNIQTNEGLKLEVTDPDFNQEDNDLRESKILERQQLIESLKLKVEVLRAEGITLDRVKTEHMIIDVSEIESLDDYAQSERIGQRFFMSPKVATERYGDKAKHLSVFKLSERELSTSEGTSYTEESEKQSKQTKQYEIWDRKNLKYYTIGEGYPGYLTEPVSPQDEVGEQWYPYFPLGLNKVDGKFWPLSDVELIKELQDEISTSLTQFKEHRQKSVPFTIFNKTSIDEETMKKITDPKFMEFIGIDGIADKPLDQMFHEVKPNTIDPQVYGTAHLEQKMEQVIGSNEATQPKNNRSKTLGEAKILTQDVATDSTSDQDDLEEWYGDIALYVWQILLKVLTPEQVEQIAGEGSDWPKARQSLPTIYNQLRLQVKPGSSGKPDKQRETETLTTLMPPITEMIMQIADFKEKGQDELAETQTKILQEFLRRADEKFDVAEFFPEDDNAAELKAQKEQERQAQQQAQLQAIELDNAVKQSEIQKNNAEAEKNIALAEAALNPQPQQADNSELEIFKIQEKSASDMRKAELDAATKVKIAQDKLTADLEKQRLTNQALIEVANIERDTELQKATIQEKISDKKLLAESNNKDKDIEGQKETAEISAKAKDDEKKKEAKTSNAE